MNENPAGTDWVGARGEKWRAHISGMESMLAPVHEPLVAALDLRAPSRIADIGCGGGETAREILRRAPAGSVVHGFDISPALVEMARRRARPDEEGLVFELADMATAQPESAYDRLVSRFGVMFFDDPPGAFSNLRRWLEPGGRFAFAVWGRPSENLWIGTVRDVVTRIVPVPQPDPDAPGPFRYGDEGKLLSLLRQAGFDDLDVRAWKGKLPIGGALPAAEAAHFAISAFSTFGELLAEAGEGALDEARRALTSAFSPHERDGAVWMDARVHIVTGRAAVT